MINDDLLSLSHTHTLARTYLALLHIHHLCALGSSVVADSITPNAQEALFKSGETRLEVTFYTNIIVLIWMTGTTLLSGDLVGCLSFILDDRVGSLMLFSYTLLAYVAISCHMHIVRRFGGVAAVVLGTLRKAMTIMLSFIIFPKEFDINYVFGSVLVLGGLLTASFAKQKIKANKADAQKEEAQLMNLVNSTNSLQNLVEMNANGSGIGHTASFDNEDPTERGQERYRLSKQQQQQMQSR